MNDTNTQWDVTIDEKIPEEMMTEKHSPGPWFRVKLDKGMDEEAYSAVIRSQPPPYENVDHKRSPGYSNVCIMTRPFGIEMGKNGQLCRQFKDANAALIAAAPELLEACDIALDAMCGNGYGETCGIWDLRTKAKQNDIFAAIAKCKAATAKARTVTQHNATQQEDQTMSEGIGPTDDRELREHHTQGEKYLHDKLRDMTLQLARYHRRIELIQRHWKDNNLNGLEKVLADHAAELALNDRTKENGENDETRS